MVKKDLRKIKEKNLKLKKDELLKAAKQAKIDTGDIKEEDISGYQEAIQKYGDKSETELLSELEVMVEKGRNDGTFSEDMLNAFVNNVMPMMDESQRDKLKKIAEMIKADKPG